MHFKGPKILGKIELPEKREKVKTLNRENIVHNIESAMEHNAKVLNHRIHSIPGGPSEELLNHNAQIRPEAYQDAQGFSEHYINQDLDLSQQQKANYEHDPRRDGPLAEEALFTMLNKLVGERYLVLKSSDYDDYNNKTDLIMMDTVTGQTICSFDEVLENNKETHSDASRYEKKIKQIEGKLQKGYGCYVKYGIQMEGGELQLTSLKHVPPLVLELDRNNLLDMLQEMDFDIQSNLSEKEQTALQYTLNKATEQIENFSAIIDQKTDSKLSYTAVHDLLKHMQEHLDVLAGGPPPQIRTHELVIETDQAA